MKMLLKRVIPNFVLITYQFIHFSKRSCWEEQIHSQFGLLFWIQWCVTASLRCLVWNSSQHKSEKMSKLKLNFLFPARSIGKMNEIICDHHKIWNNFCKMKNNWEECPIYYTEKGVCVVNLHTYVYSHSFSLSCRKYNLLLTQLHNTLNQPVDIAPRESTNDQSH